MDHLDGLCPVALAGQDIIAGKVLNSSVRRVLQCGQIMLRHADASKHSNTSGDLIANSKCHCDRMIFDVSLCTPGSNRCLQTSPMLLCVSRYLLSTVIIKTGTGAHVLTCVEHDTESLRWNWGKGACLCRLLGPMQACRTSSVSL